MNTEFRYQLDKSSKKHICPGCGGKTFVLYIDTRSGNPLPERYGRCDREIKCTYHINPYSEGYGKEEKQVPWNPPVITPNPITFIPGDVLKSTLKGYEENCFIRNLRYNVPFPFEVKDLENVISQYFLGTIIKGDRVGAITFPFIDINGKVRTIQVKEFDLMNHTTGTDFLHSIIERSCQRNNEPLPDWLQSYQKNEKKVTCLFGEHLLQKYYHNPIALVEAPKSAIYGTLYFGFPDDPRNLLWMAVYNLSSLTYEKCQSLKGRHVYLFPDLSKDGKAFKLWNKKARELSERMPGTLFKISELLEQEASEPERLKGSDIADFLIKQDWRKFRLQSENSEKIEPLNKPFFAPEATKTVLSDRVVTMEDPVIKKGTWSDEITQLENFFKVVKLPAEPVQLDQITKITDISKFINCELSIVKAQNGNPRFKPYLERLQELRKILMLNQN